jgi:hypothetical protein
MRDLDFAARLTLRQERQLGSMMPKIAKRFSETCSLEHFIF